MPGLRFYGRKWQFGADDVTIPSFVCSLSRVVWIVLLSVFYTAATRSNLDCSDNVIWYASFALTAYCITFMVYVSMLIVSCRGTVLEVEKRWCMPGLFRVLTLCIVFETSMTIYGSYLATVEEDPCEHDTLIPYDALRVVVIGSWIDIFFSTCCGGFAFSLSSSDEEDILKRSPGSHNKKKDESIRGCYLWGDDEENQLDFREPMLSTGNRQFSNSQHPSGERRTDEIDESNNNAEGEEEDGEEEEDRYSFDSKEERESDSRIDSSTTVIAGAMPILEPDGRFTREEEVEDDLEKSTKTWNRRLRVFASCFQCFTCGLFGGLNGTGGPEAFQQVSVVVAGWFKNLDLVPSDIVAALFLMRAEQLQMEASAVDAILKERQHSGRGTARRRAFTHVGRWMWSTHGPNERASSRIHAQQIRESRDARRLRVASTASDDVPTAVRDTDETREVFALDPEARELLLFASDMAPFMLGMYGWLLFSYMHGIRGWLTIIFSAVRRCCSRCRYAGTAHDSADEDDDRALTAQFLSPSSSGSAPGAPRRLWVLNDGCCEFNAAALVERVGRKSAARADVVYASFATFNGQAVPYSVCVDHNKRRVVVAVRGLITISDALTQVTMVPCPLAPFARKWGFEDDIDADSHAHSGLLRIAAWMREDLQRRDVLHRLFGISARDESEPLPCADGHDARERAFSVEPRELPDCRGYELDITGHSLGGGIAVILSLFLRPAFPNVRCMAFSPPGCVFDWKLAIRCSSWVSCLFVGKDFAPRMSWHSLLKLRGQVLDTLRRDKATKIGAIVSSIAGRPIDQLLYKPDEVPDSRHSREMEHKIDELSSRRQTTLDTVRLFAPGKVMHLMKDETVTRNCYRSEKHFVPMWIDDRSALDEILLSTRMAFDHFPDVVDRVLSGVVREYCTSG